MIDRRKLLFGTAAVAGAAAAGIWVAGVAEAVATRNWSGMTYDEAMRALRGPVYVSLAGLPVPT